MLNNIYAELDDLREEIENVTNPWKGPKGWAIWFGKLEKAEEEGLKACHKLREEIDALIEERGSGPYELIKVYLPGDDDL